ncbi:MAG: DUF1592 domain-containing protein [Planctomycetaceae bacterium]|nr:DUF1592 domain-containing protein [Planctomycetaceae bacterium]MCB9953379.1 DUF1592 domain-containing protein [Planctomycetaceae bacterium]
MNAFRLLICSLTFCGGLALLQECRGDDQRAVLGKDYSGQVQPFLKRYCIDCHGPDEPEAMLDLSGFKTVEDVTSAHQVWLTILERVEAHEMPPQEEATQPKDAERAELTRWVRAMRSHEAQRYAGDPGVVLARRLSNAEYNYSIRDLTGVDIEPTKAFPVDPANEAGFDNTGESLTMSPALLNKYLEAARLVSEYLYLSPSGIHFAPHPIVTETDRDKFCVKRIVEFYEQQPTDLRDYFYVCWRYRSSREKSESTTLESFAEQERVSPKYAKLVWEALGSEDQVGPLKVLQQLFQEMPTELSADEASERCVQMRDYVQKIRPTLSRTFDNLEINEVHKGSQSFVLWKNEQYAAHRRDFDPGKLIVDSEELPEETPQELVIPQNDADREWYLNSVAKFCSVFPDAFYISERGRDYLGVAKENQEKGRLLSAGFHSMMGYFRDDVPLRELILDETGNAELDRLWQELDFITYAPLRQYQGFLWFERTDSRYMRDPVFDFARAEDKSAASQVMIEKLAEVYLAKARENGGEGVPLQAIADYFKNINTQIQWVENARAESESIQLDALLAFANRAWRRELSAAEQQQVRDFYTLLRAEDGLDHEEAMRDSLVSILMSPHFMYRTDLISSGSGSRPLTPFELKNRLSYFLWSSMPVTEDDAEESIKPESVAKQARAMLRDDRIRGLATEFAANWLDVRRFEEHNSVDRNRFPQFTDELRQAMYEEPVRFFVDIVQQDRSILELLDSQHSFVNPVLAQHYGIDDITFEGNEWKRVDDMSKYGRGGPLGMSVFLTKNSPGLRTSPVKRGYWVVRRLLGERIPPPPPNVPDLPEDESQLGELSLPEMLARHRDNKSCAGCHDRFDSIGIAFEGFGPIGERRTMDLGGRPVETDAEFPGGMQGTGLEGVRTYLVQERREEFVDNFCRKLLAYALGRGLMLSDEPLIETMKSRLTENDYRFSSLIESIVTSPQFLTKRGQDYLVED